jgi:TRAP transporter TAXI family solute receptor
MAMGVLKSVVDRACLAGKWVVEELRTFRGPGKTSPRAKVIALVALLSLITVVTLAGNLITDYARIDHLRIATGRQGSEYNTFGEALKTVIERHHRRIRIELVTDTQGSRDSMERLKRKEVDLALAQNDTPGQGSVRSIALLFPEVLHLYVRDEAAVHRVDQLRGKRIATLPEGSGTARSLEHLLAHYKSTPDEDFAEVVYSDPDQAHAKFRDGQVDAVFHIIALGDMAKDCIGPSLRTGGRLLPIEQIEALRWAHPFLEPAKIPKGFYRGYPPQPQTDIPTAAVRAVLLVRKGMDGDIVYQITRTLYEHRNELITANRLAVGMRRPDKPEEILFPLHRGARAYYDRDKPGILVTYADPLALFLSLTVLCVSGIWHLRLRLARRRKDWADTYNLEILNLVERVRKIEDPGELEEVRQDLFDIFKRVVEDVARERVSTESFQLFAFPWEIYTTVSSRCRIGMPGERLQAATCEKAAEGMIQLPVTKQRES